MSKIFDLPSMAQRYSVPGEIIIEWTEQGFLPEPAFIAGELYWCGPSVDFHDFVTRCNGGQPTLQKIWWYDYESEGLIACI